MYVSIDVGGTNSRIAIFNSFENPKIHDIATFPHSGGYSEDVKNIASSIKKMTNERVDGIGMSIAGLLNKDKSQLQVCPNLPGWMGQPIKSDLMEIFDCSVVLDNDGAATALGEAMFGHGRGKDFLFLIWGTGIGGTAVENVNGQLHVSPFEPGHYPLVWNGELCPCGQRGCLEVSCGGAGIEARYGKPAKELTEQEWEEVIESFAQAMISIAMIRPTSLIIMSGSIAVKQKSRIEKINNIMHDNMKVFDPPKIEISLFNEHAGLYGGLGLLKKHLHADIL